LCGHKSVMVADLNFKLGRSLYVSYSFVSFIKLIRVLFPLARFIGKKMTQVIS
jgi:hypothetical protein